MSYRELARAVPLSFLFLGLIARLPFAIMPIATLTLLYTATGSYTFAGAATAAQSIATAAGGIGVGALADRLGPRRVAVGAALAHAACAAALVAASRADRPAMVAAAIAVGVTQPAVGPLARVHWARLLRAGRRAGLLPTAAPGRVGPAQRATSGATDPPIPHPPTAGPPHKRAGSALARSPMTREWRTPSFCPCRSANPEHRTRRRSQ